MKKKYYWIIIIILFGLIPNQGIAQIIIPEMDEYLERIRLNHTMEGIRENTYKNVEGSPFLPEEFGEGRVRLKDARLFSGKLRFDIYANEMQFIANETVYLIAFPGDIEFIEIEGLKFIYAYCLYKISGADLLKSYFVVLMDDNNKLLAKKEVLLLDAEPTKPYIPAKPAHFTQKKDSYYIKKKNLPAVKITNSKSLIEILADKETEVLSFIKKEKISHKNLQDLKKLVEYYNGLEEREE